MTICIMVCTIYIRNEFKSCIFSRRTGIRELLVHPIHVLHVLLVDELVQLGDDVLAIRVSLQVIDVRLHLAMIIKC